MVYGERCKIVIVSFAVTIADLGLSYYFLHNGGSVVFCYIVCQIGYRVIMAVTNHFVHVFPHVLFPCDLLFADRWITLFHFAHTAHHLVLGFLVKIVGVLAHFFDCCFPGRFISAQFITDALGSMTAGTVYTDQALTGTVVGLHRQVAQQSKSGQQQQE